MTTPSAMQPTSSASSADEITRMQWLLRQIVGSLPASRDWLDPALEREAKYFGNSYIVPPVVQAPIEPVRPDILEKLTYHKYQRDDLTLDDCLEYLCNQWKKIHGRTERAMVMQITELLASQPVAAPIVATVPSYLNDWDRISKAARIACEQYGQWMPERWLQMFVEAYNEAAPSPTEQASDVRPVDWEFHIDLFESAAQELRSEMVSFGMDEGVIQRAMQNATNYAVATMQQVYDDKSAAPADKGNATAESKS